MNFRRQIAALALLVASCGAASAQSTINPNQPAASSPLTSAPVRGNFTNAYNDINGILSMHPASILAGCPSAPLVGTDCLVNGVNPLSWYKYIGLPTGYQLIGTLNPTTGTFNVQLPFGTSVVNPGTGVAEWVIPVQTVTGPNKSYLTADMFKKTRRSNSGSAMSDNLPAAGTTGLTNGTRIEIANVDASAGDTVGAGSGTTISIGTVVAGSSYTVPPGRDIWFVYDLASTTWRGDANTATAAILNPGASSVVAGDLTKFCDTTGLTLCDAGAPIGTTGNAVPVLNANNTFSGNNVHSGGEQFSQITMPSVSGTQCAQFVSNALGGAGATPCEQSKGFVTNFFSAVSSSWVVEKQNGTFVPVSGSFTANTHSSTLVDNISVNTNTLLVGQVITGSGIPANDTIATINSSSSVTLATAASTSLTGTTLNWATGSCGFEEMDYYAAPLQLSMMIFGQGPTSGGCNVAQNTSIVVLPAYFVSYYFFGAYYTFNNASQSGFVIDTQRYGVWDGPIVAYSGTGNAYALVPAHGPGLIACSNSTACWNIDFKYYLETVLFSQTNLVNALLYIDPSQGNGGNQLQSSSLVDNLFYINAIEGNNTVSYLIEIGSPSNAFQVAGENIFTFGNLEGANTSTINIGPGGTVNDANLGTNTWNGNCQVTGSNTSTRCITTDASWDTFNLGSLNCNQNATGQINVFWNTNAANNTIYTQQAIKCLAGFVTDNSTAKTNYILPWQDCPKQVTVVTSGSSPYTVPLCPSVNGVPPLWIDDEMVGAGGGGAGSGTSPGAATAGGGSTWNSTQTASGGGAGGPGNGGLGSSGTISSGVCTDFQNGGLGGATSSTTNSAGQPGGASRWAGQGPGGPSGANAGQAAIANSGSGGGGAGAGGTAAPGGGGGAGAWCRTILSQPSFVNSGTIALSVGAAGNGGTAGTSGAAGGNGAAGKHVITAGWRN